MLKRISAALVAAAAFLCFVPAHAQISQGVRVCNPDYPTRCIKPAADGSIAVTGSLTPSGTQHVDGTGVAGTPAGGVLSVQGVSGGTAQPVSGTLTGVTTVSTVTTVTNPVGVKGSDGSAIASAANPVPTTNTSLGTDNSTAPVSAMAMGITGSGTILQVTTGERASVSNGISGTRAMASAVVGQLDNTTPAAPSENNFSPLRIEPDRGLLVHEAGNSFVNVTTNTDTNVKGSPGTIVGFSVNTLGTTSTLKLYNDADGTCSSSLIGTWSTILQNSQQIGPINATVGICAQTSGAGAADVTIYYR